MLRRALLPATVAAGTLLALAGPAGAQVVVPDGNATPDTNAGAVFTISNGVTYVLLGAVLPIVIGLLQRDSNPGWVKVAIAGAVSTVATALAEQVQDDGSAPLSQEFLLKAIVVFAFAVGTYGGVWKQIADGRFNTDRLGVISPLPEPRHPA